MAFPLQFFLETIVLPNLLMAKDKKKKKGSKKDDASEDFLDVAALSIKKFRKVTKEINKLSTGQKLVGGIALVAAGLAYLATQEEGGAGHEKTDSEDAAAPLLLHGHQRELNTSDNEDEFETPMKPHKPRKITKAQPKPGPEA
jgi:hypothetical protein